MTPKRPEHAVQLEIPVGFHQCDPLGVLWHGRYFELFEYARGALMKSVGLDVPVIREMGYRMYVTEVRCRYMAPLSFGDVAKVTAWFGEPAPLLRVSYDVHEPTRGTWCARATTMLATTDAHGALLPRTPDDMLARLPAR
ncbi:MAG: acyl-CoA thioesterase [Planctomycetes bacterium]|nr:acyl-CoA thioesterase [Planctomycetota bacterium]